MSQNVHACLNGAQDVMELLEQWAELGWLRALDTAFARLLLQQAEEAEQPLPPLTLLAAALVSHQVGRGHVCLDLAQLATTRVDDLLSLPPEDRPVPNEALRPSAVLAGVMSDDWHQALAQPLVIGGGNANTPLVCADLRLYLRRYWGYEQRIAAGIQARLAPVSAIADPDSDQGRALKTALDGLFGAEPTPLNWQKLACALAARHGFGVITGGPGTGKTTTVVRLLAALQSAASQRVDAPQSLRIRLAAPTGKAAARLSDSIAAAVGQLPLGELPGGASLAHAIPTVVTTLHRLLGSRPGSRAFRHNRRNPLALDVLVIDEASMVDVEMMASVFDALPASARLILLGDKDQLASVDAGAVLGELCQRADGGYYTAATADWLRAMTGMTVPDDCLDPAGVALDQSIAMLRVSYRFNAGSGVGMLASAVNAGRLDAGLVSQFRGSTYGDVAWMPLTGPDPRGRLAGHALTGSPEAFAWTDVDTAPVPTGYQHYLEVMNNGQPEQGAENSDIDAWAASVLAAFSDFQVLCALRHGPYGVDGLNALIESALVRAGQINTDKGWYRGRPILVTRNDYNLGLMNGDIGIALDRPGEDRLLRRVAFPATDGQGGIRWISPSRLQSVETVFAMTVHKSQGSEFSHTCLVLPDRLSPVLTRELIYTGITRARHWLSVVMANERVVLDACRRGVIRTSGLGRILGCTIDQSGHKPAIEKEGGTS